ncbi:MAG: Na(+)-translocating NADH-quinone reductase subunit A [Bacteroidales bacterium]|nr:Na(+)-translocating NADH-quinone reductase subunit A [Bacteroidales bacterium]
MSSTINLKHGLNVPLNGEAELRVAPKFVLSEVALKPTDFRGLLPKLLVKEGEEVKAGAPLFADKKNPAILFTSPVSGVVSRVVRGEKRKLLAVTVKPSQTQEYVDFTPKTGAKTADALKELLLESGLWPLLVQRPYGIVADPAKTPKAIFVSTFSTAPLAADTAFTLGGEVAAIQAGLDAVALLTSGKVHVSLYAKTAATSPFAKLQNCEFHVFEGKHPAGNVGVQISHIAPIQKGETVWTITLEGLAAIGKLIKTGKVDLSRKVALTGPATYDACYIDAVPGLAIADLANFYSDSQKEDIRFISGNALSGVNVGADGFLGFGDNQITLLPEGNTYELFGWAKPIRCSQFSSSRTYFSWLTPNKKYDMDTNLHGGVRSFVLSDVYAKVLPMDIYPVFLTKACLAKDIDKMEKFGIYEVLEEDLALCEYVDPSKNDIQQIIADGINLMLKEMA